MKKITLTLAFLALVLQCNAQFSKPSQGDVVFLPFAGILFIGDYETNFALGASIRSFKTDHRANRFTAFVALKEKASPVESGINSSGDISINRIFIDYAIEFHRGDRRNSSFYWGPSIGFAGNLDLDQFVYRGVISAGFDLYPSDRFYIKPEAGLGIYHFNKPVSFSSIGMSSEARSFLGAHLLVAIILKLF